MKKLLITILITFLIFICFITIKGEFENKLLNNANYGLPVLIKNGHVSNLFIGSSMFRQGLDAKVLENNGLDSFVLSYNGNNPTLELWILNYLIKNKVIIDNLYIDLYAYSLSTKPSISDSKILMETNLKGKYELYTLINENINFSDFYSIFVSSNMDIFLTYPIYYPINNSTFYKGGITDGKTGLSHEELMDLDVDVILKEDINNENIIAITEIIKLAKENNINLTFIETPKTYRIFNNEYYNYLMDNYKKILDENNTRYYLANDINNEISNDSYNFFDLIHLSNEGRNKYSTYLAQFLKNKD